MISFFETTCYLIGLTFVAATFFVVECKTHSSEITEDCIRHLLMDIGN